MNNLIKAIILIVPYKTESFYFHEYHSFQKLKFQFEFKQFQFSIHLGFTIASVQFKFKKNDCFSDE